jgi:hypothetical protein
LKPEWTATESGWLLDAAELLAEPDPGPTPWLIEGLMVDAALVACVGRWKTTKSYALLHLCICIATGRPAFGAFAIPEPGPVVFCNEESGRAALWRRLDALARGSAIDPEELRGQLKVAANARIKLDDRAWQEELLAIGKELRPRLIALDPLARMKAPARDENAQTEMGSLIEFIRELRDKTGAAIAFVHHIGHVGGHMRGSSDLESIWESRLTWSREEHASAVLLENAHREAESGDPFTYRIAWDASTRSMRFEAIVEALAPQPPELSERILDWLREHRAGTTDEIRKAVGVRKADVQRTLEELQQQRVLERSPSGRRDKWGRPIHDKAWKLARQAGLWPVLQAGNRQVDPRPMQCGPAAWGETPLGGSPPDAPSDGPARNGRPRLGEELYPVSLAEAGNEGLITEVEFAELYELHKLIAVTTGAGAAS